MVQPNILPAATLPLNSDDIVMVFQDGHLRQAPNAQVGMAAPPGGSTGGGSGGGNTALVTLVDGPVVNWDTSMGNTAKLTIGGNRTIAAPTNLQDGQQYTLRIIQDSTGGRLITWSSVFNWAGGVDPVLITTPGAVSVATFTSDGTNLYMLAFDTNFSGWTNRNTFNVGLNYVGLAFGSTFPGTAGTDYFPAVASDFDAYQQKLINHFRFSFRWERVQQSLNATLDPTYLGYIDQGIGYMAARNQKCTIVAFDQGKYNTNTMGDGTLLPTHFANLWGQLAAHYASNTTVEGYELMNEPANFTGSGATWVTFAQAAINAIRAHDTVKPIYIDGYNFSSAYSWVDENPTLHTLTDPNNNLIFTAHCYFDRDSSGSHYDWATEVAAGDSLDGGATLDTNIGVKRYSVFVNWLKQHNLKGHTSELGTGEQSNNYGWSQVLDTTLQYLQVNGIPFTYFAGRLFADDYQYYLGPSTSTPLIDLSQMAIVTKYSGAPQPVKYWVTVPSYFGTSGVASTAMTVYYRGNLSQNVQVTPSDNGAGGTFSPSTIVLTSGTFNPSLTFTYTPASARVSQISFTNNGGLIDAPSFQYVSLALTGFSHLKEWFDASDRTSFAPDASNNVIQMFDKSGNSNTATAVVSPVSDTHTINGLNTITADGISQTMARNSSLLSLPNSDNTSIIVFSVNSNSGDNDISSITGGGTREIRLTNNGTSITAINGSGAAAELDGLTPSTGQVHIAVMRNVGTGTGTTYLWLDGVQAPNRGDAAHFTGVDRARLFGSGDLFPPSAFINIAETMEFNSAIAITDINAIINGVLRSKWGYSGPDLAAEVFGTMTNGTLITDPLITGRIVPAGVTSINIEIWAGGGDGSSNGSFGGGGGGGGAYCKRTSKTVTPGATINFTLPTKGHKALCDSMTALPGADGNFGFGGAGGVASGGDTNTNGSAGSNASGSNGGASGASPNGGTSAARDVDGTVPGAGGGGMSVSGRIGLGAGGGIKFSW